MFQFLNFHFYHRALQGLIPFLLLSHSLFSLSLCKFVDRTFSVVKGRTFSLVEFEGGLVDRTFSPRTFSVHPTKPVTLLLTWATRKSNLRVTAIFCALDPPGKNHREKLDPLFGELFPSYFGQIVTTKVL